MKYYQLVFYSGDGNFETMEILIDHEKFMSIQAALHGGAQFIGVKDRVIKSNMIKEIAPANHIVDEYLAMGVSLKSLGLPELKKLASSPVEKENIKKLDEMRVGSGLGKSFPS